MTEKDGKEMEVGGNWGKFLKYQIHSLQDSLNEIMPPQDNRIFCLEIKKKGKILLQ